MSKISWSNDWHINYYQEPKDRRGYCYGTYLGHRDMIYITPLPEEMMERVISGQPLFPLTDAERWLDCSRFRHALETGQPISIPVSKFELTIDHGMFSKDPPKMVVSLELDYGLIAKVLAERAWANELLLNLEDIPEISKPRPWLWDDKATVTFHGPILDNNHKEIWPDKIRQPTYRDEDSKKSNERAERAPKKKGNRKSKNASG
jgi:hypothetical protein